MSHRLTLGKKLLLVVLPVTLLFGSLEATRRVRYAVRHSDWRWLAFGLFGQYPGRRTIPSTESIAASLRHIDPRVGYIACVGGSTTRGVYNDDTHQFPFILQQLIAARRPGRFGMLNLGTGGAASENYGRVLDQTLAAVTPVLVIFYSGHNDLFINPVNKLYATFMAHSLLWLEKRSLLMLTAHEKYVIATVNRPGRVLTPARLQQIQDEFRHNMLGHVGALQRRGVRVLLIPEVVMAKKFGGPTNNYEHYAELYRPMPTVLREVAEARGVEYLDVSPDFNREDFRLNFIDPAHLTDRGNEMLARLIMERSRTLRQVVEDR